MDEMEPQGVYPSPYAAFAMTANAVFAYMVAVLATIGATMLAVASDDREGRDDAR